MIRNSWWLGVCLALVVPCAFAADPPAAPAKQDVPFLGGFLKETRIVYPLQLGDWKADGEHLYEDQQFGVSVRYTNTDDRIGWIDLYFLSCRCVVGRGLRASRRHRARRHPQGAFAGWRTATLGELGKFSFTVPSSQGKAEEEHGYSFDLTMDEEGRAFSSAMTLMLDRLYFIKGRYSVPSDTRSRADTRERLQQFMAQLTPRLDIASSGECWIPLPIEKLDADQPDPKDTLATMGAPKPVHFVLKDRVLSRDPGSSEAEIMMMLGMALHNRLFPGCDGNEPQNPDVPEGMREIRLEYQPPDKKGAPAESVRLPKVGET